jgi:hypothetical protein
MTFSRITRRALFKRSAALATLTAGSGLMSHISAASADELPPDDLTKVDLEGKTITLLANAAHGKSWSLTRPSCSARWSPPARFSTSRSGPPLTRRF